MSKYKGIVNSLISLCNYNIECSKLFRFKENHDSFLSAVIFIIFLPLLPLLLEYLASGGTVQATSITLVASFFTLALGSSSKSKFFFSFSVLIGVTYAAFYPIVLLKGGYYKIVDKSALFIIIFAIFFHMSERYIRHVKERDPFLNWWYGKEETQEKKITIENLKRKRSSLEEKRKEKVNEIKIKQASFEEDYDNYKLQRDIKESKKHLEEIDRELSIVNKEINSLEIDIVNCN